MFKSLYRASLFGQIKGNCKSLKRFFLSDAFKCTEAWENRLKVPVFQKIQFNSLYAELDRSFSSGQKISVLDIDLFISGIVEETYQNELEDILEKLRANPETSVMYERTSHAAIRSLLSWNKKGDLLNILGQRLIYGLFPDVYLSLLMIDTFLKENDVISAVKIGVLQMLQEDCNHPILKGLSLYSCIKYLNSPDVWPTPKEEISEDDEVVKVRVEYARNEYYDDHFDIVDTNHLLGKTMCAFGKTVEGPIGTSCQLIGLILHEKFDEAKTFVANLIQKNLPIYKEAVEKAESYVQCKPKQSIKGENNNDEEGEKVKANTISGEKSEESPVKMELAKLLDQLKNKNLLPDHLETVLKEYAMEEVKRHEENYIKNQCEIYKKWEEDRMRNIDEEILEEKKRSVKSEIEELRNQLQQEEQRLFYFDNEIEYDEIVEEKKVELENIKYFVPKKKKNISGHETYVPPRITRTTT